MPDEMVDRLLPDASILIGQTAMPKERLDRAPNLKAIFNVETNFLPNIDYEHCQARNIYVLSPTSSFAQAVAESALAMAIDLARGITAADRAFRAGSEPYGLDANKGCFMFAGARGIIGFGDLSRTLRALLTRSAIRSRSTIPGCRPTSSARRLRQPRWTRCFFTSRIIFVFAT
jgi:phosphoglycerate dehydrogenase-like enzyme